MAKKKAPVKKGTVEPLNDQTRKKAKKVKKTSYLKLASRVMDGFRPIQYFLSAIGRFPLFASKNKEDGTYTFKVSYLLPNGFLFLFTSGLLFVLIGLINLNLLYTIFGPSPLDTRKPKYLKVEEMAALEKGLILRHVIFVVFILANTLNATWGSINYILKKSLIKNYFSYWSRIIQRQLLDIAGGMWFWSVSRLIAYFGVLTSLLALYALHIGTSIQSIPACMSLLLFRIFKANLYDFDKNNYLKHKLGDEIQWILYPGCGILIILIMIWSKSFIIMFLYFVQLIEKTIGVWNGRTYASVLRAGQHTWTKVGRNAHKILFKDHCVIMDLLEGSDRFYGTIIEGFLLLHVVSLITEVYFAITYAMLNGRITDQYRKGDAETWRYFIRPSDSLFYAILAAHNIYFIYVLIKFGAHVTEEGIAALEIIRQKSMLGRRTNEEIYFKWSIYYSLTSYRGVAMELGGYIDFTREFMVAVLSTYAAYFIILNQFRPYIDYDPGKREVVTGKHYRALMGRLLKILEPGLIDCHWIGSLEKTTNSDCNNYTAEVSGSQ